MIQNSDTPYCRDEIDGKYIYKSYCKLIGVNTHNEKAKHGGRWAVVVVLVMQVGGARGIVHFVTWIAQLVGRMTLLFGLYSEKVS